MKKANIACIQFAPVTAQKEKNLEKMIFWINKVIKEHPQTDLIILPELSNTGYDATKEEFEEMAEPQAVGETSEKISRLAKENNCYITYGYAERDGDILYNSMIMFGRKGEFVQNYRKIHPFALEKVWCHAGEEWKLAETDIGRLGMMICYDTSFPEAAGTLCRMGADMLIISSNWEDPYFYDWDLVTKSRAYDNTLFVAASNRVGKDRKNSFFGHSCIVNPEGKAEQILDGEEDYIWQSIDLEETDRLRSGYYTSLKDRRPDTYTI